MRMILWTVPHFIVVCSSPRGRDGEAWYRSRVKASTGKAKPRRALSQKTEGYCWPTYIKVLGVLCLGEVSSTFLPSKKACWAHQFQYLGVGQQYPSVL